jgi:uncharacterized protein (DUF2147 family)
VIGESAAWIAEDDLGWSGPMSMRGIVTGVVLVGTLAASSAAQTASVIEGRWLTPTQQEMTIAACVEGHCGYISRVVVTEEMRAKYGDRVDSVAVYKDANNRDPELRNRPIEGLQILTLRRGSDDRHFEGEIYNPEDGNTYNGYLEVVDADTLKLRGCAVMFLCKEQLWERVR